MNHLLDLAGALLYTVFITIVSPLLFLLYAIFGLIALTHAIHAFMKQAFVRIKNRGLANPLIKYRLTVRQLLHI
jgi:hypothetical protein